MISELKAGRAVQLTSWKIPRAIGMDSIGTRGSKRFCLVPSIIIPPDCTDLFVVAYVLLDTVKKLSEMVLFCEVNNTL